MIDRQDAASALASVATARRRAFELRGYAHAGAILIGWGLAWLVCNLLAFAFPQWGAKSWPAGIAAAALFSMLQGRGRSRFGWRVLATVGVVLGLFAATTILLGVHHRDLYNVVAALFVAASYGVLGIWGGARFAWIGLILAAVALGGWYGDPERIRLWLGLGGGGALILSGLWLRRA